jgi:PKD repeat protein
MRYIITLVVLVSYTVASAQGVTKRALFLGNSYTGVNNLPQMVANIATSMGDTFIYDSNTPGGYTFQGHSTNTTSLSKIEQGNWDYVVLQEQSQYPSFPNSQVEMSVFPYAALLDSLIHLHNPCAETVFYMTWGRKNGDAQNCGFWPPVCTYAGMDSLLNLRYRMMAEDNDAILSPVGAVWKYIRENYPSIELYQSDESHPSVAGTYAAACAFYSTLFRKDPTTISYSANLSASEAANIRTATKAIVYDNLLEWHIGEYDPMAGFNYSVQNDMELTFTNTSVNATSFHWSFGDGSTSQEANPTHTYASSGTYTIQLTATKCGKTSTTQHTIDTTLPVGIDEMNATQDFTIYPNPATTHVNVQSSASKNITYKIISAHGQEVLSGIIMSGDNHINVSSISSGLYILKLMDGEHSIDSYTIVKGDY